jgi:hypothetical protein
MPKNNFTKEQMDALNQFINESIERQAVHDAFRHLENKIDRAMGSRYSRDSKLEKLLNSDLFKQPEPPKPVVKGKIDLSKYEDTTFG